jgi:hypothetical protein
MAVGMVVVDITVTAAAAGMETGTAEQIKL